MSNQPPVRPWFRLTSIRPVPTPAPAPAPAPEPRPTLALPTFRTASAPSSPQHHQPQPQEKTTEHAANSSPPSHNHRAVSSSSSSSLPSSPLQRAAPQPPPSSSSPEKTSTTNHSPKTIKQTVNSPTMQKSPRVKPNAPPPSPLTLPPSQFKNEEPKIPVEAEPKAVLVQKTVDNSKPWHSGHDSGGELHRNHGNAHHGKHKERENKERKVSDSEDSGMRVITIAGENRGAYMELIQSPKKQHELPKYLHKKGKTNVKVDGGGESESSGAEEGNINKKDKNHKGRTTSSFPMAAYMNSNVQCVNNSLLYHTSCSHHDPGVRLSLSKKPFGEGYHLREHVDGHDT